MVIFLTLNKFKSVWKVIYEALCFDVAQGRMREAPMRLELTRVGLLVKFANCYTTKGTPNLFEKNLKIFFHLLQHWLACWLTIAVFLIHYFGNELAEPFYTDLKF